MAATWLILHDMSALELSVAKGGYTSVVAAAVLVVVVAMHIHCVSSVIYTGAAAGFILFLTM